MKKKYILLHFSQFKKYSKIDGIKFINISLLPPPWWHLRMNPSNEPQLFPDKEVYQKFKTNKLTHIEFEMIYELKLKELKKSGWLDEYIKGLENLEKYNTIAFMYSTHPTSTTNVDVLVKFLKENYNIDFEVVKPIEPIRSI